MIIHVAIIATDDYTTSILTSTNNIAIIIIDGKVAVARDNNATINIDVARNNKTAIIIVDGTVAVDVT